MNNTANTYRNSPEYLAACHRAAQQRAQMRHRVAPLENVGKMPGRMPSRLFRANEVHA